MNLIGQSAFWVSVLSILVGGQVLFKNPRDKLYLAFAAVCLIVSFWTLSFFLSVRVMREHFYSIHLFLNLWIAPLSLLFLRFFVRSSDRVSRVIFGASIACSAILSVMMIFFGVHHNPSWLVALNFSPVFLFVQVGWLMFQVRRSAPIVGARKRKPLYLGVLIVLSICTLDHVPALGHVLPTLGNVALAVYLFLTSQAITQQRFVQLDRLLSRTLVILVISIILAGFYAIFYSWIENNPALFLLNSFILSFLVIFLLDPIRDLVTRVTLRFQSKKQRILDQVLEEALTRMDPLVDEALIFDEMLKTLEKVIEPSGISFYLCNDSKQVFQLERSWTISSEVTEIGYEHPLLHEVRTLKERGDLPILLAPVLMAERDRSFSRIEKDTYTKQIRELRALGGHLLLPIFSGGSLFGLIVCAAAHPPRLWGENWGFLRSVDLYLNQVAKKLEGYDHFKKQKEKDRLATLGEMSAGLAHEIRNPLGAIKGAVQLIQMDSNNPNARFLDVIHEEVDRLNQVVTQFLEYSKPFHVASDVVNLQVLTEKTVQLLRPSFAENLELDIQTSREPVEVMGSFDLLMQVWINLLQNSMKAVGEVIEPKIQIKITAGDEVRVDFWDNGCGIPKANLSKLFIPFFTTSPSGTGLGLAICSRVIEAHGGRIEVSSEVGQFSNFSVILPVNYEG